MEPEGSFPRSQDPTNSATSICLMPPSYFLKIHFNIMLPYTHMSFKWFPSFKFLHHHPICTSPLSHTCYMPLPSQSSWFDRPYREVSKGWLIHVEPWSCKGYLLLSQCGPGSSVGIATGYWLDGPGIESRWGRDFPHLSRPALGPT